MILTKSTNLPLIKRLPTVRGRLHAAEPLGRLTWFKVGGAADVFYSPDDAEDLTGFLAECSADIPVIVMGNASNMLVRDGGVRGVVIRLGEKFKYVKIDGCFIHAGGGASDITIARVARDASLKGLEFLTGIPGTIGGSVAMNAGAYGREIKNVLVSCTVVDRKGLLREIPASAMSFGYRKTSLTSGEIITAVKLRARPGDVNTIRTKMSEIQSARLASQPVRTPTGGSTFKNLPNASAWELIEAAGCRGLRRGGAIVSEQHCNFLVNADGASAEDLEMLGEEVRRRVLAFSGRQLEWEIRRVGQPLSDAEV